nr:auxin transport protein BIG [Tanacetum cinerariifolium]
LLSSALEMLVPGHAVGKVMGRGRANVDNIRNVNILHFFMAMIKIIFLVSGKEAKIIKKECMSYHFTTQDNVIVEGLLFLEMIQESRCRWKLLNLLMSLLPATLFAGENATKYFELLFKMIETEDAHLLLTVHGCLTTICKLITQEVSNVESLERSSRIYIS